MAILSIGELLGIGPSELSGLVPYSSLEYSGAVITGISGSAIGGQGGGSDPSAISAIASAYAESAASSKVDTTAFNDCCSAVDSALSGISAAVSGVTGNTGTYIPASASGDFQPSGDYAYNSSVSGKLDGSASSTWYPKEGNPSGFLTAHQSLSGYATETYVDSSVSGKQDASGMSAYALSSDVSGVVDTVSANSASWGGGGGTGDYVEKSALNVNIGSGNTSTDGSFVAGVGNSASGSIEFGLMPFVYGSGNTAEPGGVAFGWGNIASAYDFVQGSGNSAFNNNVFAQGCGNYGNVTCFVQGLENSAVDDGFAQGEYNTASGIAFAQGSNNRASSYSFAQGTDNSASTYSFAQGTGNKASYDSFAQGDHNSALYDSLAQGDHNTASDHSFAQGTGNSAYADSLAQGSRNTATGYSFAQGSSNSATNTAVVFGKNNLRGDGNTYTGDSAAFAIGDGTSTAARHDLLLVTKDGEIRTYSSTADTAGLPIIATLRAISAWATANGWTGTP